MAVGEVVLDPGRPARAGLDRRRAAVPATERPGGIGRLAHRAHNGRTTQVANLRSDRSYALRATQRWTYAEDVQTCQVTGGSGPAFDVPFTAKGNQSFRPPQSVNQAQIDCPDAFALTQLGPPLFSGIGIVLLPALIIFGTAGLIGWYGIRRSRLTPEATD